MRFHLPTLLACIAICIASLPSGAPAQPAPAPAASPAAEKTIFLIRGPDGVVTAIRAVSSQLQGAVLVLVGANGSRAVVQPRTVIGKLPWYSDEELASGSIHLGGLAAAYEASALRVPSLRKALNSEAARFRTMEKSREDEVLGRKKAIDARIQAATAAVYDPAAGYTIEALEALLRDSDAVRADIPDAAERIDLWAAPFREHLKKLKDGSRYLNGAWLTVEDMARQERAAREAAFLKSLEYEVEGLALPADVVGSVLRTALLTAAGAILAGLALIWFARQRALWLGAGILLLAGGPVVLAAMFFLATRDPGHLPSVGADAGEQPLVAALSQAAGVDASPLEKHDIPDSALNAFLAHHIKVRRQADPGGEAVVREALAGTFSPNRLSIFELVRSLGLNWIVRYDLMIHPADGKTNLAVVRVRIGELDCPTALSQQLWKSLEPQLAAVLAATRLTERFAVQSPVDGAIQLVPITTKPVSAQPMPAPAEPVAASLPAVHAPDSAGDLPPIGKSSGPRPITALADWASVEPVFRDGAGDIIPRDPADPAATRANSWGRNDIVQAKVTSDSRNFYFYVESAEPLTAPNDRQFKDETDTALPVSAGGKTRGDLRNFGLTKSEVDARLEPYTAWMQLLIDADCNAATGWFGYDYVVNRAAPGPKGAVLERYDAGTHAWSKVADVGMVINRNRMALSIPRSLCPEAAGSPVKLDFKWTDNVPLDRVKSPDDFALYGDVAPNAARNYHFEQGTGPGGAPGQPGVITRMSLQNLPAIE
ncbi:MAG: hypothetical protein PHC88_02810 [Terrimicrobiaceae bacterium]|nr:hypothetical protein [Terrimicrobiaceae bacterium]